MAVRRPIERGRALDASELGRQVAVDPEPDADSDEGRCRPGHAHVLLDRAMRLVGEYLVQAHRLRNAVACGWFGSDMPFDPNRLRTLTPPGMLDMFGRTKENGAASGSRSEDEKAQGSNPINTGRSGERCR